MHNICNHCERIMYVSIQYCISFNCVHPAKKPNLKHQITCFFFMLMTFNNFSKHYSKLEEMNKCPLSSYSSITTFQPQEPVAVCL